MHSGWFHTFLHTLVLRDRQDRRMHILNHPNMPLKRSIVFYTFENSYAIDDFQHCIVSPKCCVNYDDVSVTKLLRNCILYRLHTVCNKPYRNNGPRRIHQWNRANYQHRSQRDMLLVLPTRNLDDESQYSIFLFVDLKYYVILSSYYVMTSSSRVITISFDVVRWWWVMPSTNGK